MTDLMKGWLEIRRVDMRFYKKILHKGEKKRKMSKKKRKKKKNKNREGSLRRMNCYSEGTTQLHFDCFIV